MKQLVKIFVKDSHTSNPEASINKFLQDNPSYVIDSISMTGADTSGGWFRYAVTVVFSVQDKKSATANGIVQK